MKKSKFFFAILFFILSNSIYAQTIQFGKISEDPKEKYYGVVGVIGKSYYTLSANTEGKGSVCYIHKCSSETMEIQETQKIELNDLDMLRKSWSILKVDKRLILIIADWDREAANKVYGEVLVNADGTINTGANLKVIAEWDNPEVDGKKIIMGTNILIIASPEIEGLPTANSKVLVYYQKNKDWSFKEYDFKTDMLNFVLFDKDLKKVDNQITNFDNAQIPLQDPIMDTEGNFYLLPRTNQLNREIYKNINDASGYIYDVHNKKIVKQALPFNSFTNSEKAMSINNCRINPKGNLVFAGFYNAGGKTEFGPTSDGLYINEMNAKGNVKFDYFLIDNKIFDQTHSIKNKNAVGTQGYLFVYLTNNYVLVEKKLKETDKKGLSIGNESNDYVILKKDDNGRFSKISSYSSEVYFTMGSRKLRPTKSEFAEIEPAFIEAKDKLYMVISPFLEEFKAMNLKNASDRILALNSFDFKGGLETKFLYNIDVKTNHPKIVYNYKLNNGECLIWDDFIRSDVAKINFK